VSAVTAERHHADERGDARRRGHEHSDVAPACPRARRSDRLERDDSGSRSIELNAVMEGARFGVASCASRYRSRIDARSNVDTRFGI
jgi:hypothetical protein